MRIHSKPCDPRSWHIVPITYSKLVWGFFACHSLDGPLLCLSVSGEAKGRILQCMLILKNDGYIKIPKDFLLYRKPLLNVCWWEECGCGGHAKSSKLFHHYSGSVKSFEIPLIPLHSLKVVFCSTNGMALLGYCSAVMDELALLELWATHPPMM